MGAQTNLSQLFLRNNKTRLINSLVQIGLATKPCGRGRGPNKVENSFITVQRMTCPVGTNQVEHPMLNQVPFGGPRRIMVDRNNQVKLIGQLLQLEPPEPRPVAIGTPAISLDQEAPLPWIAMTAQFQPPSPDGGDRKLGGIMGGPDQNIALVMSDVVDAIQQGFALSQTQKVIEV